MRTCPLCNGCGKIKNLSQYTDKQRKDARKLYANGVPLRAIAKKIGMKGENHPQKVKSLIMSKLY
jgi:hypothetical protein